MSSMSLLKRSLVALSFAVAACAAQADAVIGNFLIKDGAASASGGTVTFTLQGDGTIAASLHSTSGRIVGFGFDSSTVNLPESGFPAGEPVNPFGWGDMYGSHASGFRATGTLSDISWVIGNVGDFSSVNDVLTGSGSVYDFFLYTEFNNQWAANAEAVTGTPEPATALLLLAAVGGLAATQRRRA